MTEPTADMFPETLPREVALTDPADIIRLGEMHGLLRAQEALQAVPENKRVPGFAYALALIDREAADARASMTSRNLRAIARAGIDITAVANVGARGSTLIVTPAPPGEEA